MAQSKAFADASHALNDLSHALALLEAENAKLRESLEFANNECEKESIEFLNLQAENAKLRDENARLRSCLSDDAENAQMIIGENAKLLELVEDMWNDMSVCYEQHVRISSSDMRFYGDRLREFGIEVDG